MVAHSTDAGIVEAMIQPRDEIVAGGLSRFGPLELGGGFSDTSQIAWSRGLRNRHHDERQHKSNAQYY
jgi:hypothetical protein